MCFLILRKVHSPVLDNVLRDHAAQHHFWDLLFGVYGSGDCLVPRAAAGAGVRCCRAMSHGHHGGTHSGATGLPVQLAHRIVSTGQGSC